MDKQLFFPEILLAEFLLKYFYDDNWYKLPGSMKDILAKEIKETEIKSEVKNLIHNGNVYIGENCTFGDNVVIDGPSYIDDDCEIATGAYIRAGSYIGKGCSVGHAAETKNLIMMNGSKISNHTFAGDSILGVKARLGGHSELANRRFDQEAIDIVINDSVFHTGLDKYGAIIGNGARLGGGVFTSPGTAIGFRTFVSTGTKIGGYIPAEKFVKTEDNIKILDNKFKGELHNKNRIYE